MKSLRLLLLYILMGKEVAVMAVVYATLIVKGKKTIDQVPAEFIPVKKPRINKKTGEVIVEKENFVDKLYKKVFTRHENEVAEPSVNAVPIPDEFLPKTEESAGPDGAETPSG